MSWYNDPNCEAASQSEHAAMAYAVDMDFPSGHVRLCTWTSPLTIDSNVFEGIGQIAKITSPPDRARLTTERWSYGVANIPVSVVPESEIDNCFGRSVVEYEVWINPETHAVIGYEINREGTMGRVRRTHGGPAPEIEVGCETRLVILERADGWRYTSEHQAKFFSGDTGFDEVRKIESIEILWGGFRGGIGHLVRSVVREARG